MLARVDTVPVSADALWWPAMNFDQFRWDAPVGLYELEFPRAIFAQRLATSYAQCVRELRADELLVADQQASALRDAGYPPLDEVLEHGTAVFELLSVYLYEDIFAAFIPHPASAAARFMINSVDRVASSPETIIVYGRGYHCVPRSPDSASQR